MACLKAVSWLRDIHSILVRFLCNVLRWLAQKGHLFDYEAKGQHAGMRRAPTILLLLNKQVNPLTLKLKLTLHLYILTIVWTR